MKSNLARFQSGEQSEFNNSFATLETMRNLMNTANDAKFMKNLNGADIWLTALNGLDNELHAYMSEEEKKEIKKYQNILIPKNKRHEKALYDNIKTKLNEYERKLREIHTSKGFGIIAKADAGSALEMDTIM